MACYTEHRKGRHYITRRQGNSTVCENRDEEGFFWKNKDQYKSLVIDDEGAPGGKAYVGLAKKPLMKNVDGYGFQGVVLQDEARQFVQCSACGAWMRKITSPHLKSCSGITVKEYRARFKVANGVSLAADEVSCRYAENGRKAMSLAHKRMLRDGEKLRKRISHKDRLKAVKRGLNSGSFRNLKGTCEAQIGARLKEFLLTKRRLPHSRNGGSSLVGLLERRYGSLANGLTHYGLPTPKQRGRLTEYYFPDGTVYFYKYGVPGNFEGLYAMMLDRCELLKKTE